MKFFKCEDEHDGHFDGTDHPYGEKVRADQMWQIKTPFSSFKVCSACKARLESLGQIEQATRMAL